MKNLDTVAKNKIFNAAMEIYNSLPDNKFGSDVDYKAVGLLFVCNIKRIIRENITKYHAQSEDIGKTDDHEVVINAGEDTIICKK